MSALAVVNMGCRLNIAEGEAMRALLHDAGETIVINSCAVTQAAVHEAHRAVRRAHRTQPGASIIVTGCAAQLDPAGFADLPGVARVLGNADKLDPASFAPDAPRVRVSDILAARAPLTAPARTGDAHARAFIEVQNGCDHRCTFCIIPFARGPSRSVPVTALVEQVRAAADRGAGEVVLTGVDVTSYGADLPGKPRFGMLVQRLLRDVPALRRLRLSSLDVAEIDDALLEALASEPRLMPHLHLSLQAGDDMILARMKRRHRRADAVRQVERIRAARPETSIGADLIAGFPTETDAMFENSLRLLDDCDIVHAHVFPFSPRAGTPAARMPQLPVTTRRARSARLRARAGERHRRFLDAMVGTKQQVLIDSSRGLGHAENFARVRVEGARGAVVRARITSRDDDVLIGVRA